MSNDHWISAYYVSKFITNSSINSLGGSSLSLTSLEDNLPSSSKVPSKQSSVIVSELALDRTLRRKVMKARRKAYREGLETGIMTNFVWSSRSTRRQVSSIVADFGDDDWTTEEEDEDHNGITKSAVKRGRRLKVMHEMPDCFDKDLARRLQTLKKVKIFHSSSKLV